MVNKEMKFLDNGDIRYEIVDASARSNIQTINTVLDTKANTSNVTALDTRVTAVEGEVSALGNGSPAPVATVAEMTDESAVYLYTGSETGYTAGNWYYYNGSAWTSGGVYGGAVTSTTFDKHGVPADDFAVGQALAEKADADDVGDLSQLTTTAKDSLVSAITELKEDLSNVRTGSEFLWELGTLTPGTGVEQTGNTRVRSLFIPVTTGTEITLATPNNRLLVYCFDSSKSYVSDSPWIFTNKFTVTDASVAFVRILIRKDTNNSSISSEEIETLVQDFAVAYVLPKSVYTEMPTLDKLKDSLDGSRYLRNIEIGSMSNGKPTVSTAYIRSADFIRVHKGDVFRATPIGFSLYYGSIYKYATDNENGYDSSVTIPAVTTGKKWEYAFESDCWIKFRVSNKSSGALITPKDLYTFNDTFYLEHLYDADELLQSVGGLSIDYDTLNSSISGNFNLAIQTDTHMAKYVGYTGSEYAPSNFNDLESVVNSINLLDIDVFANLGDFIRGYQCDPDYESRETADAMLECYRRIKTNRAFVIGNHDDGCLFYSNTTYNDNPSTQQVMFPNEQFNRYTKFGLNDKGTSNYYYADTNGVRIITLYQRDFDYSSAIPQIEAFNISANQLSWLTATALDTDLPVIVLTHAPLVSSLYATSRGGFDEVLSALDSFVNGGGTVIAVLSGHTHAQNTVKINGINHIVFKNGYDLFELVSVDLSNRTISCKAINGSSADLSLTY